MPFILIILSRTNPSENADNKLLSGDIPAKYLAEAMKALLSQTEQTELHERLLEKQRLRWELRDALLCVIGRMGLSIEIRAAWIAGGCAVRAG